MTEERKRELMLRFAVENGGEWPSKYDFLVVATELNDKRAGRFDFVESPLGSSSVGALRESVLKYWHPVCTRTEYEDFIKSLFKDAPEDAECWHPISKMFYVKLDHAFVIIGDDNIIYHGAQLDESAQGLLIPRPRKQIDIDGLHDASVEGIKEAIENDTVPSFSESGKWMPDVGQECEVYGGVYGSDDMRWMKAEVMGVKDGEVLAESTSHSGTYVFYARGMFRPLKTEAEKERERLATELFSDATDSDMPIEDAKTTALFNDCLRAIDRGWHK